MSEIIAPSATELEAFKAAAQRIGHTVREFECNMVESFAAVGRAALAAAYPWSGKPPAWLPLPRRTYPTHFGRKRRARRARGRRIETRREMPQMVTLNLGQAYGKSRALRQQLEARVGRRSAHHVAPAGGPGR
jgi:hypothetical protein